ncbi:MAG: RimK/LysX family protein [Methanohalobium sp.]|uniref:putative ATP-dependent zinc protease n=1 Tax=Methanohalobium sp. TaxID=2837493 RepID=UPI00397DCB32
MDYSDTKDIQNFLMFTGNEQNLFREFDLSEEAILPLMLSLKSGGSWSYSTDVLSVMSVKNPTTYFDEERNTGYTFEEIYLFLNPEILTRDGSVYRLEKCGKRGERVLVKRPYRIKVKGERVVLAQVHPELKKIDISEPEHKTILFTGTPAYSVAHEMEHLTTGDIEGEPIWNFEFSKSK